MNRNRMSGPSLMYLSIDKAPWKNWMRRGEEWGREAMGGVDLVVSRPPPQVLGRHYRARWGWGKKAEGRQNWSGNDGLQGSSCPGVDRNGSLTCCQILFFLLSFGAWHGLPQFCASYLAGIAPSRTIWAAGALCGVRELIFPYCKTTSGCFPDSTRYRGMGKQSGIGSGSECTLYQCWFLKSLCHTETVHPCATSNTLFYWNSHGLTNICELTVR